MLSFHYSSLLVGLCITIYHRLFMSSHSTRQSIYNCLQFLTFFVIIFKFLGCYIVVGHHGLCLIRYLLPFDLVALRFLLAQLWFLCHLILVLLLSYFALFYSFYIIIPFSIRRFYHTPDILISFKKSTHPSSTYFKIGISQHLSDSLHNILFCNGIISIILFS